MESFITDRSDFEKLRKDFASPFFRKQLKENVGSCCCNCGSKRKIQYHHIVPLHLGGTNAFSNIVPLCVSCHKSAHFGQHISKYSDRTTSGRPRKYSLTIENEHYLWEWARGEITNDMLKKILGIGKKETKIQDIIIVKEFKEKNGIRKIRNYVGVAKKNGGDLQEKYLLSRIIFINGETKEFRGRIPMSCLET